MAKLTDIRVSWVCPHKGLRSSMLCSSTRGSSSIPSMYPMSRFSILAGMRSPSAVYRGGPQVYRYAFTLGAITCEWALKKHYTGSKSCNVKAVTEHWQTQLQLENARTSIMYRQQMDLNSARVKSHAWTSHRQLLRADPREKCEGHKCK